MEREKLSSRLGFILLSAGCAIGIGNVWKFPYMVGQYGGGTFVLLYLFFLIILGVPIMTMEFAMGRASQKSPVKFYQVLQKPGQKWHIHGYICLAINILVMMFYTTVTGWMLYYVYAAAFGKYDGMDSSQISTFFTNTLTSPSIQLICVIIICVVGFLIISIGLQNGLEKVTKFMMLALMILMVVLAVNSMLMKNGTEGLIFYLKPDFGKMMSIGMGNVVLAAMTQAFYTLGLGMGAMAIFGSYIGKDRALLGESVNVAILDTIVAVCAGLIIFPACAAYNIDVDSGPSLLFITLPNLFNALPGGRIWGTLFFTFMLFAAFSTALALFENIVSMFMDLLGWSRKKTSFMCIPLLIGLSIPCALGFSVLSGIQPLGAGSSILDLEDFIVSNFGFPLGSMVFLLFCVLKKGWGWDNFMKEANTGKGMKIKNWMKFYLKFILPVIVAIVFILGIINKFK